MDFCVLHAAQRVANILILWNLCRSRFYSSGAVPGEMSVLVLWKYPLEITVRHCQLVSGFLVSWAVQRGVKDRNFHVCFVMFHRRQSCMNMVSAFHQLYQRGLKCRIIHVRVIMWLATLPRVSLRPAILSKFCLTPCAIRLCELQRRFRADCISLV